MVEAVVTTGTIRRESSGQIVTSNKPTPNFSHAFHVVQPTLLSFAASEVAADEFAAKNRPPCNGPPI